MYRASLRASPARVARAVRQPGAAGGSTASARRLIGTAAPAPKRGTWKGTAARWGLAAGVLYWYNTSPIFADETARIAIAAPSPEDVEVDLQTIDALLEHKQKQEVEKAAAAAAAAAEAEAATAATEAEKPAEEGASAPTVGEAMGAGAGSPEALEEEASQQGAFNPETGEINWDCPCLGGMAHGPCGEDFKAAFSCFVYSAEEPKGMDCIDKFQNMQDCFRQYPEIYGAELDDEEAGSGDLAEGAAGAAGAEGADPQQPGSIEGVAAASSSDGKEAAGVAAEAVPEAPSVPSAVPQDAAPATLTPETKAESSTTAAAAAAAAEAASEEKFPEFEHAPAVPKQAWDATEANAEAKK